MSTAPSSAESSLRVAVLGCGAQGRNHLNAYTALPGIEIAAICDLDEARRDATGDHYGVPPSGRFADYRDLLHHSASRPLDIVSICTMPISHREMTVAALDAGANVICEKPTALNLAEAQAMHEAAVRNERLLTVGFNMRFLPAAQFLKRYVDDGGIGTPVWGHAWTMATDIPWWGKHYVKAISGGGVLASTAVHILDLALWMRGNPTPTTVSCSMATLYPRKRAVTAPTPAAHEDFDVEDTFNAHIRFTDGTFLSLTGGWSHDQPAYSYSFELVGDRAAIEFAPLRVVEERDGKPVDITPELPSVETSETGMDDWGSSVKAEIGDLVSAIRTGSAPTVHFEQAMTVQAIVDACYRSAELGREVDVAPISVASGLG